jgi:hypothetical protein
LRRGAVLLLALALACKKPKRLERVSFCIVYSVSNNAGAWRISMGSGGVREVRGKVIASLFEVDPHRPAPNRTLVCSLERDASWTNFTGQELEGVPSPACQGDAPYGRYRELSISLLPENPPRELVACQFNAVPPTEFGGDKTIEDAIAEYPNPVARLLFLDLSPGATPRPRATVYVRIPPTWVKHPYFSEMGAREVVAKFSSEWARANGLSSEKLLGSAPVTAADLAKPIWGDGTEPNVHFFEVTDKGTIERRGFAFAPLPPKP